MSRPNLKSIHQEYDYKIASSSKHSSPIALHTQQTPLYVSFTVFEQTFQKLQQQITKLELQYETINTIRDQHIQIEGRIENIESHVHLKDIYYQVSTTKSQNDLNVLQSQISEYRRNTMTQIDEKEVQEIIDSELDKYKKETQRKLQDIEQLTQVFQQQTNKKLEDISFQNELFSRNDSQLIQKHIEGLRIELDKIIQTTQKSPSQELFDKTVSLLRQEIQTLDCEILKIFRHVKQLLDVDQLNNRLMTDIETIRRAQNEQRSAIREIQKCLNRPG